MAEIQLMPKDLPDDFDLLPGDSFTYTDPASDTIYDLRIGVVVRPPSVLVIGLSIYHVYLHQYIRTEIDGDVTPSEKMYECASFRSALATAEKFVLRIKEN